MIEDYLGKRGDLDVLAVYPIVEASNWVPSAHQTLGVVAAMFTRNGKTTPTVLRLTHFKGETRISSCDEARNARQAINAAAEQACY
jgi:hypothetical protein